MAAASGLSARGLLHRRRAAAVSAFVFVTAALAVYLNRHYSGDLYWLLAAGRETASHGVASQDPFLTLSHSRPWQDQQWLVGLLFYGTVVLGGLSLLSLLYGLLLGLALLPLVIGCRNRRPWPVLGAWLLSLPMLVAVLNPRAEGFSLLAFAILVMLTDVSRRRQRVWWIPLVFLLWANLHAAFVVGFLFLALVVIGAEVDRRRGLPGRAFSRRFIAIGVALPLTLVTPLGPKIFDYFSSLSGRAALPRLTYEWDPSWQHPYTLVYPLLILGYGAWLYRVRARPWPLEPALVLVGFAVFATTATRQMVWLGPLCFYLLRQLGSQGSIAASRRFSLPVAVAAALAISGWLFFWAPPPNEPKLLTGAARYAAAQPSNGRLAAPPGTGSYLLWISPRTPVTIDGRFENYSDAELLGDYDVVDHSGRWQQLISSWGVTRIVTRNSEAALLYQREGWIVQYQHAGQYVLSRR